MTNYEYHQLLKFLYFEGYADSYENAEYLMEEMNDDEFYGLYESVIINSKIVKHLVAEGYADTNQAAEAIMVNMSEDWRQSIVEGVSKRGQELAHRTGQVANRALSRTTDPEKRAALHGLSHAAANRSFGEYPDTPDMMVGGKPVRTVHDVRRGGTGGGDPDSDRSPRGREGVGNRSARRRRTGGR